MNAPGPLAFDPNLIDWQRPWLAPWRELGMAVAAMVAQGACVHEALNANHAAPHAGVRFVAQSALPAGMAYEQFIFESRAVPTRDNLHDFFNGLAWLQFPQIKNRLNALQAAQIAKAGVNAHRGRVRDALTLVDENAAFLCAPPPLCEALAVMDWAQLFGPLRPLWGQAQLVIFGHALLEKLVQPRKPMVAHVLRTWESGLNLQADHLDEPFSRWLQADGLAQKPFAPLPVLGVPGWWPDNASPAFYDDASVFRAPRAVAQHANNRTLAVQIPSGT